MNAARWCLAAATLLLAACGNFGTVKEKGSGKGASVISGPYEMDDDAPPLPDTIPADVANLPDAVPRAEPPSKSGNPETYEALGETYKVQKSADGFREKGYASWYGRKFHGHRTASGEKYDMFAMTAAHKTLPLPSFVRVKRVGTNKAVVVRVNDRGPFHSKRIIDLSYAAAAKLGILENGQALVEIETVTALEPGAPVEVAATEPIKASVAAPGTAPIAVATPLPAMPTAVTPANTEALRHPGWLQAGVYNDPINAVALREDLTAAGITQVAIRSSTLGDSSMHRVLVGPFTDAAASTALRDKLLSRGLSADWVSE